MTTTEVEGPPTERATMVWPKDLKNRVRDKVGPRGLTDYTVAAVERHLQDSDQLDELTLELNQSKALIQLLADRLAMGLDVRHEAVMEIDLPEWLDTTGWLPEYAALVRPSSTPVEAPVDNLVVQTGEKSWGESEGSAPISDIEPSEGIEGATTPIQITEAAPSGERTDLFAKVMERTGGQLDPGFSSLKPASELPVPPKPEQPEVHNHAWVKIDDVYTCECTAIIDESDPVTYPNGVVREPIVIPLEEGEAVVLAPATLIDEVPTQPIGVPELAVPHGAPAATVNLDDIEVDF